MTLGAVCADSVLIRVRCGKWSKAFECWRLAAKRAHSGQSADAYVCPQAACNVRLRVILSSRRSLSNETDGLASCGRHLVNAMRRTTRFEVLLQGRVLFHHQTERDEILLE